MPRQESVPIPLRYIDATRATRTTLDVMLERRTNDYWDVDGHRDLSDSWTGFTRFTMLDEKPPDGYTWCGERLTKKQTTSTPDYLWPERYGKTCQKHRNEKKIESGLPKNRSLTLEDCAVSTSLIQQMRISKFAKKKSEESWKFRCQQRKIKGRKFLETCRAPGTRNTKDACIVEADESTRKRLEGTPHKRPKAQVSNGYVSSCSEWCRPCVEPVLMVSSLS